MTETSNKLDENFLLLVEIEGGGERTCDLMNSGGTFFPPSLFGATMAWPAGLKSLLNISL